MSWLNGNKFFDVTRVLHTVLRFVEELFDLFFAPGVALLSTKANNFIYKSRRRSIRREAVSLSQRLPVNFFGNTS